MTRILLIAGARRVLLLVGLVLAGLPAGSALADTTIGHVGGDFSFLGTDGAAAADTSYVVPPGGGRITSFSFQSGPENLGEQLDFLVLRPTGGLDTYTVVGKSDLVTLTGAPTGNSLETFPADIAMQGGDILGIWTPGPLHNFGGGGGGNLQFTQSVPDPNTADGIFLPAGASGIDLNESANLAPPLPTSKQQCKHGGWKSFGTTFKNQGQCVSFLATGGKHPPTG